AGEPEVVGAGGVHLLHAAFADLAVFTEGGADLPVPGVFDREGDDEEPVGPVVTVVIRAGGDPLGVQLAGVVARLAIDVVAVLSPARVYRDVRRFAELEFTDDVVQLLGVQNSRGVVDRERYGGLGRLRGATRSGRENDER